MVSEIINKTIPHNGFETKFHEIIKFDTELEELTVHDTINSIKTVRVDDLIAALQELRNRYGNVFVIADSDLGNIEGVLISESISETCGNNISIQIIDNP